MNIICVNEYDHNTSMQISQIFVDGFYQWLHYFSKDKEKLAKAFRHMFNPEVFHIAVENDEVLGITACTDGKTPSVRLQRKELRKHLGFIMGTVTYYVLRQEFEKKQYPFEITSGMGTVEFVAVSSKHRGKGVASAIINHIIRTTSYQEYVLEVADTNSNAVSLYRKLGYEEFLRVAQKHPEKSGINYLIYMKYTK